jgi:hypothetical protein
MTLCIEKKLSGLQSQSQHIENEKYLSPLPGIEPTFLSSLAHRPITISMGLSQLHSSLTVSSTSEGPVNLS